MSQSIPPTATSRGTSQERTALARVALAGLIWGSIPVVLRAADGSSTVKVFYRVAFAAVVVLGYMAATGRFAEITRLGRRKLLQVALQGVVLTVNWLFFLTALDMTTVATAELLGYTGPVFVAALAPLVTRERFDRRIALPLALALGGIVVILAPRGLALSGGEQMLGALLAFGSALTYATLLLRSKNILRGISGSALMVIEYSVASAILLPVTVVLYAKGSGPTGLRSYVALAVLGVVHTALAGIIFLGGLRRARTDRAAVLTYTEPVSAVVFAALFLAEPLTWEAVVGGAMVVIGGLIVSRLEPPKREPVPLEAAGTESSPEAYTPWARS